MLVLLLVSIVLVSHINIIYTAFSEVNKEAQTNKDRRYPRKYYQYDYLDNSTFVDYTTTRLFHAHTPRLYNDIDRCFENSANGDCTLHHFRNISDDAANIANTYINLLMQDVARESFLKLSRYISILGNKTDNDDHHHYSQPIQSKSSKAGENISNFPLNRTSFIHLLTERISHIRAVLAFSQGDIFGVST